MLKKINNIIKTTYTSVEKESALYKANHKKIDKRVFIVAIVASISLVFIEYIGKYPGYKLLVEFTKNIGLNKFSDFILVNP